MLTLNQFVNQNRLRPADSIIMRKKFFGMVDHYVIYLGTINGRHRFVANYTQGVRVIPNSELVQFLSYLIPKQIEAFPGNEFQRRSAVQRAESRIGEKAYDYLANNCEHFKNWVHYGEHKSYQAEGAKTLFGALAVVGIIAAIANIE